MPEHETQESIGEWSIDTFGPLTSHRVQAKRLLQEVVELCHDAGLTAREAHHIVDALLVEPQPQPDDIPKEMADCEIVLRQWAHRFAIVLQEQVDAKMPVNRARRWFLNGDGTGRHLKAGEG